VPVCTTADYAAFTYVANNQTPGTYVTLIPALDWQRYNMTALGDTAIAALTWLVLQAFRQTIQRYRIRQCQILRFMLLAALGFVLWRMTSMLAYEAVAHLQVRFDALPRLPSRPWGRWAWRGVQILPVVAFFASVAIGLQVHMRIRRGWAMGLAAGVIVGMLVMFHLVTCAVRVAR
jgi:hypothetical protein